MVRELVPADMIKMQSSSEWKRAIVAAYNNDAGMYQVAKLSTGTQGDTKSKSAWQTQYQELVYIVHPHQSIIIASYCLF